jgi:hypothetical protein
MEYKDLERLMAQLPPGTKAAILVVELPPRDGRLSSPSAGDDTAFPGSAALSKADDEGRRNWRAPERGGSVEARLSSAKQELGAGASRKPREWRELVGVTEREIERAIQFGALPSETKGYGRDHAAFVVPIEAIEGYLATVRAVRAGEMDPPSWWKAVRPQGGRGALSKKRRERSATN